MRKEQVKPLTDFKVEELVSLKEKVAELHFSYSSMREQISELKSNFSGHFEKIYDGIDKIHKGLESINHLSTKLMLLDKAVADNEKKIALLERDFETIKISMNACQKESGIRQEAQKSTIKTLKWVWGGLLGIVTITGAVIAVIINIKKV